MKRKTAREKMLQSESICDRLDQSILRQKSDSLYEKWVVNPTRDNLRKLEEFINGSEKKYPGSLARKYRHL